MLKGKVLSITDDGTALISAKINLDTFVHRKVKEVYLEPIDSRPLSDKQRRTCYGLIKAIADWSGSNTEDVKQAFKLEFWSEKVDTLQEKIFSLSNAPMSLVAEFQKFLVNFVLENDIAVNFPLNEFVDDIDSYVYMCLIHKKCAVCGKQAELHHIDTVGMGNDRTDTNHLGREAMSLCRTHHTEFHTVGKTEFFRKYHFENGIEIDKTIAKIYRLKTK